MFLKRKKLFWWGIKPMTSHRVSSRLNRWASRVDIMVCKVMLYIFCFTWRLVTYFRQDQPPHPPPPWRRLAGPPWGSLESRDRQRSRAWRRGCGGSNPGPMEEEPATWEVAVQLTSSCHDRLTGPAPDSRIGGPGPVARHIACQSQWCWLKKQSGRASARRQVDVDVCKSGGLVHAQAGPVSQKNWFCGPASQLKPSTLQKLKSQIVQENVQGFTSQPWKGMTFNAVQCFRLSYSDQRSTFRIFVPIHNSVWRRNM